MIRFRFNSTIVVPAKAGTHSSTARTADKWVPAFAGTIKKGSRGLGIAHLLFFLFLAVGTTPAHAVRPDEMLADPVLETRAREVSRELRCLVCRNQSIDDSDADLAHDLRVLVRERLKAGDSNDQAIAFVRARYGDFVLLRPPFEIGTALLWGGPLLVLLLGGVAVARLYRRREASTPPLSPEERQRLSAVLAEEEGSR
ncbi:MAG: cytochrome c-type biogenesis protein CcmH [Alphaproteobacteria bacterium]|nr:cytochrome c-type biogenesis protein CcmH [Alphaproteobacteria bacterium]MBV9966261.1 cytochrome c-type biogenesis protein CcmH [Alphaproteobacteria bacterium]